MGVEKVISSLTHLETLGFSGSSSSLSSPVFPCMSDANEPKRKAKKAVLPEMHVHTPYKITTNIILYNKMILYTDAKLNNM